MVVGLKRVAGGAGTLKSVAFSALPAYLSGLVSPEGRPEVDLKASGKLLGLYHDRKMIFRDESEVSVLMDFVICERLYDGKSLIDLELETPIERSEIRQAILKAFRSGYTSLFQVRKVDPRGGKVYLYDLLHDEEKDVTDTNLSRTADGTRLVFFRYIHLEGFSMTSGMSFVFRSKDVDTLLRRYRAELHTRFKIDKSVTRFIIFHRLDQQFGQGITLIGAEGSSEA